jgi:cobalt-zinc-cadmium resistance protein CzcA
MLSRIIDFSIKNKLIIGLFTIALIIYGSYEATRLPIDAVPDITNNQVQVITVAPSYGAVDIERLITFPVEQANNNIKGLKEIRSFSRFGLSLVTIVFNDDVDVYWARQQVAERLQQVQTEIPEGVGSISLGPVTTGLGEIYQYSLRAKPGYEKQYDETALRTMQDWVVRRQLLGVKGVADVSSFGGKLKQFEIAVNTNKLQSYNLSINDIFDALQNNNQNTGGAYIEKGPTVLYIRSEGLVGNIEDIQSIFIKNTSGGTPVLIRDVADVKIGFATRYGAMVYNDEGEVAGAVVMMLKGENSSRVVKNVKERILQIQKTLPEGVILEPFLDRTKMVNNAIGTVETNLLEGALIVLFVLIIFLGNLRAGFLVASVIPLAMLFAIIMMNYFGVIGNLMSLGALDFGLIVDGAVFIVEAVLHQLTHSKHFAHVNKLNQHQMDEEVSHASGKMARSVVFGQIIILIVYLPTFALQGIEGKMFIPMAQTVAFALLGAFILSLTYVPMMSALIMSKKITHSASKSDKVMAVVERRYQKMLDKVLHFPKTVISTALLLFAISLIVLSGMGGEFIPALEEGDFAVETRVLTGSNLNTTIEASQKAAGILKRRFPEVKQVITKIGSGEIPTDPMPMEAADMMVILKDKSEWTSAKTFPELADKMTEAVSEIPGIMVSFQFPVQMRFNELMTGAKQDVVCKIFGENMDTLAKYADKLGQLANQVEGTKNLYVEPVGGMPQVIINYNRAAIAQYGLSISEINRIVNTGFAGQSTGYVYEGEKRFEMVVRLDGSQRRNLEDIKNLLIPTASGSQVPLYQLASVEIKEGPNQIQREDAKRRIVVGFNVGGRDVQTIVEDLESKVDKQLKLPAGYFITYGGAFENLNAAKARLSITVPVSLFLIFLLLYFSFNSVKQGLLIYSAIPLSAIGGIFALAGRGMPFSISAGVGFIALFGVAVLNGIVLIAEFNRLKDEGWSDTRKRVLMGTKIRLRPVLMTGFVASLGFLPMAISNGAGAEVQRPLATVVIGGLLVATFLTLFVLPVLYLLFEAPIKFNFMRKKIGLTALFMLVLVASGVAQTPISAKAALDSALKHNLGIEGEKLSVDYYQKMRGTTYNIKPTTINLQYGNLNSAYKDNSFEVSQSFSLPVVYRNQRILLSEELKKAISGVKLKERELEKSVYEVYYDILLIAEKERLLMSRDSVFTKFLNSSNLRLNKGESNILENASAVVQHEEVMAALAQIREEKQIALLNLNQLINGNAMYTIQSGPIKLANLTVIDSSAYNSHPLVSILQQNQEIADAHKALEQSQWLPEIELGVYSMTIRGTGADNVFYDGSTRFNTARLGFGIPVFYGSKKSRIGALQVNREIAQNQTDQLKQDLLLLLRSEVRQYQSWLAIVNRYETTSLPQAKTMRIASDLQLSKGEINYLDWVVLTNQAFEIENKYLDAVRHLNEHILFIKYLTNQN